MKDPYRAVGPFHVAYEWRDGHVEQWNCDTLDRALLAFWQDDHLSQPALRTIADSTGRTIASEVEQPASFYMTREVARRVYDACDQPNLAQRVWALIKEIHA